MANPVQCVVRSRTNTARRRNRQPRPTEAVATGWRHLLGCAAEQYEFLRVATVQWQFHDSRCFHDLTDAEAARLHQTRIGLHFNLLGHLPDLKHDVDRRIAVDLQDNTCLHECAKARQSRLESVLA